MQTTSGRILELLGLLQSRVEWTAPELAVRLGVTERTVRNDVNRLRELGYPVDGLRGRTGHYRLGAGARLPPLLLDDGSRIDWKGARWSAQPGTHRLGMEGWVEEVGA